MKVAKGLAVMKIVDNRYNPLQGGEDTIKSNTKEDAITD
jgi:hypothetical protein